MIFVDTNLFMCAVGRAHPLRDEARLFFERAVEDRQALYTSAQVLQELLHAYLPVGRLQTLDDALELIARSVVDVWPLEPADVRLARGLHAQLPELDARDLCHVAACRRRGVKQVRTFDRGLAAMAGRFL